MKEHLESNDRNFTRQIEVYRLFREQIVHEDTLINERITWSLTVQSILFIALAASQSLEIKSVYSLVLPIIISGLGIILCLATIFGLSAAIASLSRIHRLAKTKEINDVITGTYELFPPISGAGASKKNRYFGANLTIRIIPIAFLIGWMILLVVSIFGNCTYIIKWHDILSQ